MYDIYTILGIAPNISYISIEQDFVFLSPGHLEIPPLPLLICSPGWNRSVEQFDLSVKLTSVQPAREDSCQPSNLGAVSNC